MNKKQLEAAWFKNTALGPGYKPLVKNLKTKEQFREEQLRIEQMKQDAKALSRHYEKVTFFEKLWWLKKQDVIEIYDHFDDKDFADLRHERFESLNGYKLKEKYNKREKELQDSLLKSINSRTKGTYEWVPKAGSWEEEGYSRVWFTRYLRLKK